MHNVFDIAQELGLVLDFASMVIGFEHPTEGWQEMWVGPDGSMEDCIKIIRDTLDEDSYDTTMDCGS